MYHTCEYFVDVSVLGNLGVRLLHRAGIQLAPLHSLSLMEGYIICRSAFGHSSCRGDGPNARAGGAWKLFT